MEREADDRVADLERQLEAVRADNERLRCALNEAERQRDAMHRFLDTPAIAITHLGRDGTVLSINERGARNLGGCPSDFEGKSIFDLLPAQAEQARQRIEHTLETGEPLTAESMVKLPAGERFFRSTYCPVLDDHKRPVSIQLVSQEITELKRIEQVLEATEGRLAGILEHAPHFIAVLDLDGSIRYINRTTESDMAKVLGSHASSYFPSSFVQPFQDAFRQVLETARPQLIEIEDRNGRHCEVRLAPSLRHGQVHQVLAFALDISERKQAEERERRLEAQVQHSQKLESLGVLAGGIAHDFNNLLVGILGNAQLAQRERESQSIDDHLQCITQAAQRAADLCRRMLAYAGHGRITLGPVHFSSLCLETLDLLRASVSKRARLRSDCPSELPLVEGDSTQLRQVVMNLLTNASQALGGDDGDIVLCCGVMDCDESYLAHAYLNEALDVGRYVYVEVTDNGCGMDRETQSRMFDPFFTTKESGSGLGLAAVLGIVRSHRGAVRVDSALGRGTTVRVILPAAHVADVQASAPAPLLQASACTILVVDDETMVRAVAKRVLEQADHRVLVAADGVEALELFDEDPSAIDAVLLDLSMPGMDGRQTLAELRARDPRLPVVLASGFSAAADERAWADDPATHFIGKPYNIDALLTALHRALAR